MKNADMPAMPVVDSRGCPSMYGVDSVEALGLTKREIIAMHMMAGLLVGCESPNNEWVASIAVDAADKLLSELDRTCQKY
ncbi:MAG: hypothetical protein ACRCXB_34820 [Aeromonadaceae bacterium]